MAIPSNSMNMRSLATIYSLGLTAGGAMNLIVRHPSSDVKQEIIYTLGAGVGALTMGIIFWKYIHSEDETEAKVPPTKTLTIEVSEDSVSITKTQSGQDKLTMPIVFGLGMLGGVKLCRNPFHGFVQGIATAGLALSAKKQEEQGTLNWKELCRDCP